MYQTVSKINKVSPKTINASGYYFATLYFIIPSPIIGLIGGCSECVRKNSENSFKEVINKYNDQRTSGNVQRQQYDFKVCMCRCHVLRNAPI